MFPFIINLQLVQLPKISEAIFMQNPPQYALLDLFYYRSNNGYEVDFFIFKNGSPFALLQVALTTDHANTINRETRSLIAAANELKIENLYIITADPVKKTFNHDNLSIHSLPAWEINTIL